MEQILSFVDLCLLVIVALWNFAAHWFPWRVIPFLVSETGELHRIVAYAHGTFTIWCGMAGWVLARYLLGICEVLAWDAVLFHGLAIGAAAAGTVVPRIVRWIAECMARAEDVADYEQAISR